MRIRAYLSHHFVLFVALSLCGLLIISNTCLVSGSETSDVGSTESGRAQFKVPKLFDFELFKSLFKKSYSSIVEELSRKRIFLARAFRVFVSAISYKYRRTSAYLAINERSDWTKEERFSSHMRLRNHNQQPHQVDPSPMVDLSDIEQKLAEISQNPQSQPGFEEIASELKSSGSSLSSRRRRRKRNVQAIPTRELSLDQLISSPESVDDSEFINTKRVPTNNPQYEPPELASAAPAASSKPPMKDIFFGEPAVAGKAFLEDEMKKESERFSLNTASSAAGFLNNKADVVYVDHRAGNCFFRPRSQGQCGSCYAFAAIALYEWYYCKMVGEKIAFSEQYVVDCGHEAGELEGCNGGYFEDMSKFVHMFGMELRADYPYRDTNDTCPYEKTTPLSARGYIRLHDGGFEEFEPEELEERLTRSPIPMAIYVDGDTFDDYGGGVDEPIYCMRGGGRDAVHAVLFVGHGREDGQEYWLLRNSYGPTWGERGYYKMSKKSKQCLTVYPKYYQLVEFSVPRTSHARDVSDEVKKRRKEYDERESKKKNRRV